MEFHTYSDPAEFLKIAQPYLQRRETANSLILGVTLRLHEHPEWTDTPPYLATVSEGGGLRLAAAMTPPFNILLAGEPDVEEAAFDLLYENLQALGWSTPGVTAEKTLAQRFGEVWGRRAGVETSVRTRMRVYELRRVIPPAQMPAGSLHPARTADVDLITGWMAAFMRESMHRDPEDDLRHDAARFIQAGTLFIWDDAGPVSMAALTRPTPHGISVGYVYTPPALRGRGYASACVAEISQRQLDAGKKFVSLFTDLDYPTSNSIYMQIGYEAVCDFDEVAFG